MTERHTITRLVRPLRKGQITIPVEFRRRLGITEDTVLRVTLSDDELHIRPMRVTEKAEGSPWVRELYEYFAPARQEAEDKGYTEEDINGWIDQAITAVRSERDEDRP